MRKTLSGVAVLLLTTACTTAPKNEEPPVKQAVEVPPVVLQTGQRAACPVTLEPTASGSTEASAVQPKNWVEACKGGLAHCMVWTCQSGMPRR